VAGPLLDKPKRATKNVKMSDGPDQHALSMDVQKHGRRPLVLYFCPVVVLLSSHMVFTRTYVYRIPHSDSVMHFMGGIALGIAILGALRIAQRMRFCREIGQWAEVILIIALVFVGAIGWEIFEWILDMVVGTQWFGRPADTAKDLILGVLGVSVLTIWRWFKARRDTEPDAAKQ